MATPSIEEEDSDTKHIDSTLRASVSETSEPSLKAATSKNHNEIETPLDPSEESNFDGALFTDELNFDADRKRLEKLCKELGLGNPAEISILTERSSNDVSVVKLAGNGFPESVITIYNRDLKEKELEETFDRVSMLQYISNYPDIKAPKVLASDSTTENPLQKRYVIQKSIPGKPMQSEYYKLPLQSKLEIVSQIAQLILNLESVKFTNLGRLIGPRDILPRSIFTATGVHDDLIPTGYRLSDSQDTLDQQKERLGYRIIAVSDDHVNHYWSRTQYDHTLVVTRISIEMIRACLAKSRDRKCVLWYPNFTARNILIQPTTTSTDNDNIASDHEKGDEWLSTQLPNKNNTFK